MGSIKEINIKSWIYYIFNDMINIKYFDSSLIDKNSYENNDIYYIGYATIKKHWSLRK